MIASVDDMKVRADIFEWCKENFKVSYFIDPRMGAETALLYTMNPQSRQDRDSYAKTLYEDKDAAQERCTARSTIYTANLLSGLVAKTVKDLITKADQYPRITHWAIGLDEQKVYRGPR